MDDVHTVACFEVITRQSMNLGIESPDAKFYQPDITYVTFFYLLFLYASYVIDCRPDRIRVHPTVLGLTQN